jgi:hypothetical protein
MKFPPLLAHKVFQFFLFWLVATLIYLPAYQGGFYEDFHGILEYYRDNDFIGFSNIHGNINKHLYQGTHILLYGLLSLFGRSPLPWLLLFTALHAINAGLVFRFFGRLLSWFDWKENQWVVFTAACFFLISPQATEIVIWKSCIHYLTSTFIIFTILTWALKYLADPSKSKYIWMSLILFYLSTFMLELFLLIPCFFFIIIFALWYSGRLDWRTAKKGVLRIVVPLVLLILVYFVTQYFFSKNVLIRYQNADTKKVTASYVMAKTPVIVMSKLFKYPFDIFFAGHYLPLDIRQKIYAFAAHPAVVAINAVILFLASLTGFIKYRKGSAHMQLLYTLFALALASCVIILPSWYFEGYPYRGSRYFYLPSAFFFIFLASFLYGLPARLQVIRKAAIVVLSVIYLGCTMYAVHNVRTTTALFYNIMHNFKWQDSEKIVLLNIPSVHKGVGIMIANSEDDFNPHLRVFTGKPVKGTVYDVAAYNLMSVNDGAHVTVLDSLSLKVTLNETDTWWCYANPVLPATDYENDLYKVTYADNNRSYILTFKQKPDEHTAILFQVGNNWRRVDMGRINVVQK